MKTIIKKSTKTHPLKHGKKSLLKKLQERLLDMWSLRVKELADFKCEVCHREKGLVVLNSHHFIGKRNPTVKWDLRNGVCLCVGCHEFSNKSAKNDPQFIVEWFKEYRPDDYEYLRVKKNKRFDKDYEAIEKLLKEQQ